MDRIKVIMKLSTLALATLLLVTGTYAFMSQTVPVQESSDSNDQQQRACNGLGVGEVDYNTSVEDRVLAFEGLFCAPYIGYSLQGSGIDVEGENVTAYADISAPQGVSGPAVKPIRFNASEELESGDYRLKIQIAVENRSSISKSSDLTIERENTPIMQRIRAFFSGLFG